jgi:hypothetical protein
MTDADHLFAWSMLSMALFGLVAFALGILVGAMYVLLKWS